MSITIVEAIYEGGVLRPTRPIDLAEGTRVDVVVTPRPVESAPPPSAPDRPKRTPAEIIAEIAALAMESSADGVSGRDHDRILYGGEGGAR